MLALLGFLSIGSIIYMNSSFSTSTDMDVNDSVSLAMRHPNILAYRSAEDYSCILYPEYNFAGEKLVIKLRQRDHCLTDEAAQIAELTDLAKDEKFTRVRSWACGRHVNINFHVDGSQAP